MSDIAAEITAGYLRAEGERERELYEVANFADRAWKVRREIARDLVAHWEVAGETYAKMLRSGPRVAANTTSPYEAVWTGSDRELRLFGIRIDRVSGVGRHDLRLVVSA